MAQVNIRIDDDLKARADALFDELGINMTTAFSMFIRQTVREGGLPFEVTTKIKTPNAVTIAAMREIEDMKKGKFPKHSMPVADFIAEMEKDD